MKTPVLMLLLCVAVPMTAQIMDHSSMQMKADPSKERLGTVSFPVSCLSASQASFNRGVALLHDFWYEEARRQFEQLEQSDPNCAMAHWGVAMSAFHQIWDRPDEESRKLGWKEMQAALKLKTGSERERAYIATLADFYRPGSAEYPTRIHAYSIASGKIYEQYPKDVDAGAFYALSLLADETPNDTSLAQQRKAMTVLKPLFAKAPDNPGVVHYIVHACDNPAMAVEGLAAADHYGEIAQSGPHAFHMPGHIYARLGLWQKDIDSQLGSIKASEAAEAHGMSGIMDEPHSYDFVIYAYLQSGQDLPAKAALEGSAAALKKIDAMPGMGVGYMAGMVPYYNTKLQAFYALEMRDWPTAAAIEAPAGASPSVAAFAAWTRAIAHGHLKQANAAVADLDRYHALMDEIRKGRDAYVAEGTGPKIQSDEIVAWVHYAEGKQQGALEHMRAAADLQDKVGQGEVDIPAREMLGDMLLEFGEPQEALAEYQVALKFSPNRLNCLYNAGRAADAAGDTEKARQFYQSLLKVTNNGQNSARPELAQAKRYLKSSEAPSPTPSK